MLNKSSKTKNKEIDMFEDWYLEDLLDKNVKTMWPLTDKYLLQLIKKVFDRIGISEDLKNFISIQQIMEKYNYVEKADRMLRWDLERLKFDDYVESKEENGTVLYKYTSKELPTDYEEIYNWCSKEDPRSVYAFRLLALVADNYEEILEGKTSGVNVIYSPENIHIINEYYQSGLFYTVNNVLGGKVLNYEVDKRESPKILELGGGLGSGTKQFLEQRKAAGKDLKSFHYHFTDVTNSMLRKTKKPLEEITGDLSNFEFSKHDFNKSLEDLGLAEEQYDIIWAVNAIHVATNLKFTLQQLYRLLKPKGTLLIVETVRPIYCPWVQHEFIINSLDDYGNVELNDEWRPVHGFMRWTNWVKAVEAGGFDIVDTVPNMTEVEAKYNNCYATVIRGQKK